MAAETSPRAPAHTNFLVNLGLLIIRSMVGIVFVLHGSQKLFGAFGGGGLNEFAFGEHGLQSMNVPMPYAAACAAALAEFVGGLSLITGVGMRIIPLFTVFTMLVASFTVHAGAFFLQNKGMEYALTLGVVTLGLVLTGPGAFSWKTTVRNMLGKKPAGV